MPELDAERLPPDLQAALAAEVDPNEHLRWHGRPDPARVVRRFAGALTTLSIMAVLFGGLGLYAAWDTRAELIGVASDYVARRSNRPTWGAVWGLGLFGGAIVAGGVLGTPLLLLGVHREARRTVHALTNTRVFSVTLNRRGMPRTTSLEPGHPLHVTRKEFRNGLGDIQLYPSRGQQGATMSLLGIRQPREVERLIRTTFDPPGAPKES